MTRKLRSSKDRNASPGKSHSSAPMSRKKDPMATRERPSTGRPTPTDRVRRNAASDVPPDEDL
jgi:hypothetical protein